MNMRKIMAGLAVTTLILGSASLALARGHHGGHYGGMMNGYAGNCGACYYTGGYQNLTPEKQAAVDSMVEMTAIAEKEAAAEILLEAKGFQDVVVSINGDGVDVVVNVPALDDIMRAQIEDIVKRKTEVSAENIIISTVVQ